MHSNKTTLNFLSLLSIITVFTFSPYLFLYLYQSYYQQVSSIFIIVLLVLTVILVRIKIDKFDAQWIFAWFVLFVSFILFAFLQDFLWDNTDEYRIALGLLRKFLFFLPTYFLIKYNYNFYLKKTLLINYIIIFLSVLLFFLLLIGIPLSHFEFQTFSDITTNHTCYYLGITNTIHNFGRVTLIRIAGFADEPGALALIITYLIILNETTICSKKSRWFLVFSGLLTFSLAFAFSLLLFILYWFKSNKNRMKFIFTLIILLSLALLCYESLHHEAIKNCIDAFLLRFQYNPNTGSFYGDNRELGSILHLGSILGDHWLTGYGTFGGPEILSHKGFFIVSITGFIASYGIYGLIFFYLPFYLLVIKKSKNIGILMLLFILLVNYLQRPGLWDPFTWICLTLIYCASRYRNHLDAFS